MRFPIQISDDESKPLYQRLSDALRSEIVSGRLGRGHFLPSTRELAKMLDVSRDTVLRSLQELTAQGYIESVAGRGTTVAARLSAEVPTRLNQSPSTQVMPEAHLEQLSSYGRWLLAMESKGINATESAEMNYGAPPFDQLPIKQWRLLLSKHCRYSKLDYHAEPAGYLPLREALCQLLNRTRAIRCTPEQVILFSGTHHCLNIIARVLLDANDSVVVENPGFCDARDAFRGRQAQIIPIDVDEQGLITERLSDIRQPVKLVYVTPAHQDPTGAVLSSQRRQNLLDWACRSASLIVEDDYNSEYRYSGTPSVALHSEDAGLVIYHSNFWKLLYPLATFAYAVVPLHLVPVFWRAKFYSQRAYPMLEQYVMTDFINEGHLERHVHKTKSVYSRRRQALVAALTQHLRQMLTISHQDAGMSLLVKLTSSISDAKIAELSKQSGMAFSSTASYYVNGHQSGEFLIAFAHLTESQIADGIARFSERLRQTLNQPVI